MTRRPELIWDAQPRDLRADPAATIAATREGLALSGAVFDVVRDHASGEQALATGLASGVEFGIVDYGEKTTYLLVNGRQGDNLDAASHVVETLIHNDVIDDDDVLEWLPSARPPAREELTGRIEELEVALARLATRAEATGSLAAGTKLDAELTSSITRRASDLLVRTAEHRQDQWYIVQTSFGSEFDVKERLEDAAMSLEKRGVRIHEVVVPGPSTVKSGLPPTRKGRKPRMARRPRSKDGDGVVLINAEVTGGYQANLIEIKHFARDVDDARRLSRAEAHSLLRRDNATGDEYSPGDYVRIIHGPFSEFSGVVLKQTARMTSVEVEIFGRSVHINLDVDQIEPLP